VSLYRDRIFFSPSSLAIKSAVPSIVCKFSPFDDSIAWRIGRRRITLSRQLSVSRQTQRNSLAKIVGAFNPAPEFSFGPELNRRTRSSRARDAARLQSWHKNTMTKLREKKSARKRGRVSRTSPLHRASHANLGGADSEHQLRPRQSAERQFRSRKTSGKASGKTDRRASRKNSFGRSVSFQPRSNLLSLSLILKQFPTNNAIPEIESSIEKRAVDRD